MRRIERLFLVLFLIFFCLCNETYSMEPKEQLRGYIKNINSVVKDVQLTHKSLTYRLFPFEGALVRMQNYIDALKVMVPPDIMIKQHNMVLLSLKKMRIGLYVLARGDRVASARLIKRSKYLMRIAIGDMLKISLQEGLFKLKVPGLSLMQLPQGHNAKPMLPPAIPQGTVPTEVSIPTRENFPSHPMIANTIGHVVGNGITSDGSMWLDVKDQLFDEVIRIKVKNIASFDNIKHGDTVNVIYYSEAGENIASSISIIRGEDKVYQSQ